MGLKGRIRADARGQAGGQGWQLVTEGRASGCHHYPPGFCSTQLTREVHLTSQSGTRSPCSTDPRALSPRPCRCSRSGDGRAGGWRVVWPGSLVVCWSQDWAPTAGSVWPAEHGSNRAAAGHARPCKLALMRSQSSGVTASDPARARITCLQPRASSKAQRSSQLVGHAALVSGAGAWCSVLVECPAPAQHLRLPVQEGVLGVHDLVEGAAAGEVEVGAPAGRAVRAEAHHSGAAKCLYAHLSGEARASSPC